MSSAAQDRLGRRVVIGVVFGVLIYAGIALATDVRALSGTLAAFPVAVFAGALGLSVINYIFRWSKWQLYLRVLDCEVDRASSVVIFLAGFTMSITPGKVGEVLKSVLLAQSHGYPVSHTGPIVIAERLTDLLGLFVIAAFGIAVFDYGRWAFAAILGAVVVGMLVVSSERAMFAMLDLVARVPVVAKVRPKLEQAYRSTRLLLAPRVLAVGTVLSTVSWSMEAAAFYWIIETLGGTAEPLLAAFIFAMTTILGAVSFLPGGLGVTEGSMIGALMLFGVFTDEVTAASATYLIRIATLWFAVVLGVGALAVFGRWRRRVAAS